MLLDKNIIKSDNICMQIDVDKFNQIVGQKIQLARKNAGFSQSKLADKINVSRTTLVNMESGKQSISIHYLFLIGKVLPTILKFEDLLPTDEEVKLNVGAKSLIDELKKSSTLSNIK